MASAHPKKIWNDALIVHGGRRVSADSNSCELPWNAPPVDISAFEDPAQVVAKGPQTTSWKYSGVGTPTEFAALKALADESDVPKDEPIIFAVDHPPIFGSFAQFLDGIVLSVPVEGSRGQAKKFTVNGMGRSRMWWGQVAHNNIGGSPITGAGTGASMHLGAVPAGKILAGVFAVVDPPGIGGTGTPAIVGRIESDNGTGFPSPITRLTFASINTPRGIYFEIDGDVTPITDDWWRIAWAAPSGTAPQFTILAAAALLTKP